MEEKVCTKCGKKKSIDDFFKDKQKKSGRRPDCKECNTKVSTNWTKNNKDKHHGYEIKHKYGITVKEYEDMLLKQNNSCAICNSHISLFKSRFHIDHCHTTGKIRGLLCVNCNHGIGTFMDNINLLENAIKYLKK